MGERGKVRKTKDASVPGVKVETGISQRPSSSLQDHEQSGSNEGVEDHSSGSSDGEEAQGGSGEEVQDQEVVHITEIIRTDAHHIVMPLLKRPWEEELINYETGCAIGTGYMHKVLEDNEKDKVKQYGEQWRGTFNGTTYRIFTTAPASFMPEMVRLQRMYSHPPEDEAWEDLWVVA